ncbi:MAG: sugar ABC transporter ATP-binding protein [Verrucomicrobia bacterium]|nr:sugar ABC transporter ATP-binding protein [Verrucomicrobiota bacterium]
MSSPKSTPPLLVVKSVSKAFPGVLALDRVSLELMPGEVLALLGENGAGKSTLIKILAGAHRPDTGSVHLRGQEVSLNTPAEAQRLGIAVIHQESNLVRGLTVSQNLFLGRERTTAGFVLARQERAASLELLRRSGAEIHPDTLCRQLTVAQQQLVEIAKALSQEARIIVMDEPSASFTNLEVARLLAIIRDLKAQGIGIIYVSHRLDEIFRLSDRVMVLRDGRHVATRPISEVNREALIELMVGRQLENEFPVRRAERGEERLAVEDLRRGDKVRGVSFSIRRGEILGLTGLIGAGRTELARLIFGADLPDSGSISLDGRKLKIRNPRDAIQAGIALLTEDRKAQGLVVGRSVRENFGLPNLPLLLRCGFVRQGRERSAFARHVESLRIRISHAEQPAQVLSGGNQQKVVLAKWLERNCPVILFDEPTRGIDVGAKYEVYLLIQELAAQGKAILMISSELPEVLGMSDRILVMHEGRIAGEITDVTHTTQEQIMNLAVGARSTASLIPSLRSAVIE